MCRRCLRSQRLLTLSPVSSPVSWSSWWAPDSHRCACGLPPTLLDSVSNLASLASQGLSEVSWEAGQPRLWLQPFPEREEISEKSLEFLC